MAEKKTKAKTETKAIEKKVDTTIMEYMKTEGVLLGFADVMGERAARAYISSVLIAVRDNDRLMKCENKSIYISALRAATLQLSVDPAARQAYLVPFKDQCTLIVSYKGLYDLALRTGKYHYINVAKVYEGEEWIEDRLSGIHRLEGARVSDKIVGWFTSFEMLGGFVKTLYMSLDEIHDHAKKYSKNYNNPKGLWKTNPQVMERKTPLRILLTQYGYIAPNDQAALIAVEAEDWIEADYKMIEDEVAEKKKNPPKKKSAKQSAEELGFDMPNDVKTVEVQPEWDKEIVELVISYTPLKDETEARKLLTASGLDPTSARVGAIKQFLIFYQASLDEGMSEKDALAHAKENWTK